MTRLTGSGAFCLTNFLTFPLTQLIARLTGGVDGVEDVVTGFGSGNKPKFVTALFG